MNKSQWKSLQERMSLKEDKTDDNHDVLLYNGWDHVHTGNHHASYQHPFKDESVTVHLGDGSWHHKKVIAKGGDQESLKKHLGSAWNPKYEGKLKDKTVRRASKPNEHVHIYHDGSWHHQVDTYGKDPVRLHNTLKGEKKI